MNPIQFLRDNREKVKRAGIPAALILLLAIILARRPSATSPISLEDLRYDDGRPALSVGLEGVTVSPDESNYIISVVESYTSERLQVPVGTDVVGFNVNKIVGMPVENGLTMWVPAVMNPGAGYDDINVLHRGSYQFNTTFQGQYTGLALSIPIFDDDGRQIGLTYALQSNYPQSGDGQPGRWVFPTTDDLAFLMTAEMYANNVIDEYDTNVIFMGITPYPAD